MARRSKKSNSVISVDFTGVEASGKVQEGRQKLTVDGTPEVRVSERSGSEYINWKFKAAGGSLYHTTSLQPQALWNLRNTLEALGLEVPEGSLDIDLTELDGLECGAEVQHEVYQGKKRPVIVDLFPLEELEGSEDEEEQDDEEAYLTYDEIMEMDKDELLEVAEEHDIKVPVKIKNKLDALREHIASELGLEGEEEDDEEEEEKPTRRKRGSRELTEGSKVTFEDDGEEIEGTVKSINAKEKFAVVDVDGEEWEVELSDLTVV